MESHEVSTGSDADQRQQTDAESALATATVVANGHLGGAPSRTGLANGHGDDGSLGDDEESGEETIAPANAGPAVASGAADAGGAAQALVPPPVGDVGAAGADTTALVVANGNHSEQRRQPQPLPAADSSEGPTFEAVEGFRYGAV